MKISVMLCTIAGVILTALGVIGIVLPILPTTPFILAAAACFSGNPRMRGMLLKVGIFKEYIENYKSRRGLRKRTVVVSLSFLWGMLALSSALVGKPWLVALLMCVGVAVSAHILYVARDRTNGEEKGIDI
ncbi:MAG: YbaN family protein [Christensenella sp.]|uniref:YbaN family protein n=1 Tax=Christensenella sp. TaxID=1935934 RepID=UPI002B1F805C|nr:YbaN family protein [Christensenella sp.]MEA5004620.1 YbaN family protein [Christensenella sp.]